MTNKEKYKKAFDVLASSETISLEADNMMNKKQKKSIFSNFLIFTKKAKR